MAGTRVEYLEEQPMPSVREPGVFEESKGAARRVSIAVGVDEGIQIAAERRYENVSSEIRGLQHGLSARRRRRRFYKHVFPYLAFALMSALFRRHSSLRCFFCHSSILIAQDPRNFHCNACGCWNRYDKSGEILSDDPAMHDVSLNSLSFAKRGILLLHRSILLLAYPAL